MAGLNCGYPYFTVDFRMIRWYDYLAAGFAAGFAAEWLWGNIQVALFSGNWLSMLFGALGAYSIFYIWDNIYTPFRVRQEANK